MESTKWKLSIDDLERWSTNGIIYSAPVFLTYFGVVASAIQDGFAWSDLAVTPMVQTAIALYIVNTLIDFFRKFASGTRSNINPE